MDGVLFPSVGSWSVQFRTAAFSRKGFGRCYYYPCRNFMLMIIIVNNTADDEARLFIVLALTTRDLQDPIRRVICVLTVPLASVPDL